MLILKTIGMFVIYVAIAVLAVWLVAAVLSVLVFIIPIIAQVILWLAVIALITVGIGKASSSKLS